MAGPIKRRHAGTTVSNNAIQPSGGGNSSTYPIPPTVNLWYDEEYEPRHTWNTIPVPTDVEFDVLASNDLVTDIYFS